MKRINSMATNWADKQCVRKGKIGEQIVRRYLESQGWMIYEPSTTGAHPFDMLVATKDKKNIYIADSKAKAARTYYPDTGIDLRHYSDYKHLQDKHSIDVYLFFVDENAGEVYGNLLSILDSARVVMGKQYPITYKGVIYFPLAAMIRIGELNTDEIAELKRLSSRSYEYGNYKI